MRIVFAALFIFCSTGHAAKWLDQSHEIFLNKELSAVSTRYREFPVFWWNFVRFEGEFDQDQREQVCRLLSAAWEIHLGKMPCSFTPEKLAALTTDWTTDTPAADPCRARMNGKRP